MITIDGRKYKVIESMGFQHSRGVHVKAIETSAGEKLAIKYPGGDWQFANPTLMPGGPIIGQGEK